jgi:hypothetical protein
MLQSRFKTLLSMTPVEEEDEEEEMQTSVECLFSIATAEEEEEIQRRSRRLSMTTLPQRSSGTGCPGCRTAS